MADTLHISDSIINIDFDDPASAYSLKFGGWAPKVASIINGGMGNRSVYSDVDEEMTLTIKGATSSAIMSSVEDLIGLIDKGKLWYEQQQDGAPSGVELLYEVGDSTMGVAMRSYIVGPSSSGPIITHPSHFDALENGLSLSPVTLRFRRQGLWRGVTSSKNDLATAQNVIAEITWDNDFAIPCPYSLTLDGMDLSAAPMENCIVLLSEEAAAGTIEYKEGESGTKISSGNIYASTADATNDARAGNVGRITSSTQETTQIKYTLTNVIEQRIVAIFAVVRVNDSAKTWMIDVFTETVNGHTNGSTRPRVVLDGADSTEPRVVFIGYVLSPVNTQAHKHIYLNVESSTASSETLDIDCIVALGMDLSNSRSLTLIPTESATNMDYIAIHPYSVYSRLPHTLGYTSAGVIWLDWRGDAWLCSRGDKISGMILATRGTAWVWTNSAGTPFVYDWKFIRTRAYLTPQ